MARCIGWRMGELEPQLPVGTDLDLVVEPRLEVWEGRQRVDLVVIDIARSNEVPFEVSTE
jgi:hypothetical protein